MATSTNSRLRYRPTGRREKMEYSTIESYYCKPKYLSAVVNDLRIQSGNRHIIICKMDGSFKIPKRSRFAVIAIERRKTEYHVILNYYATTK
jgi:hypothetical protein